MKEEEFLEHLFGEGDVPTEPEELLEFATLLYEWYLQPDSPLREVKEIDWEAFGAMLEKARDADDEVKRCEEKVREAEADLQRVLGSFLSFN